MHKLLERQLLNAFGSLDKVPPGLERFLAAVDQTYVDGDTDRALLERSMDITSQELLERNDALRDKQVESQVIFDSVPAMILFKDPENRILRINKVGALGMGLPVEQLEGKSTYDLFPPEVAKAVHDDDLEVIRTGQPKLGIIESHPGADGKPIWLRTDKVPYRNAAGHVLGVVVLCIDITERRRAEEALRDSEQRYRQLVETASEGFWSLDLEGNTTFCNPVMAGMLGGNVDQIIGTHIMHFISPEDQPYGRDVLARIAQGASERVEFRFRRLDGQHLWVQASTSPIRDASGRITGMLGMMTDITARRRAEAELRDAYARLQEVDRNKTRFLNTAAHELGTPLTPVKLQLRVVRDRFAPSMTDGQKRSLDILDRSVDRLVALVRDLLDAARLQTEHLRMDVATIDLADAVRRSVDAFADLANGSKVQIDVDAPGQVRVRADPFRIGQVLDNLVGNAVKFTPSGGKVRVRVKVEDGRAVVQVADSGIGIAPEAQRRLFQPFSQVHDAKEAFGGTGLGLYISKGIVELMGGSIHVKSDGLGRGSTFGVELPLAS